MGEAIKNVVYNRDTIEFVTVAKEFCAYLEGMEGTDRKDFMNTMLKFLPLLYLKGALIPQCEHDEDVYPEQFVTEDGYEILRMNIVATMGDMDDYLEVFVQDMVYSDKPILATISENIADIYQDVRDFVFSFQLGNEEVMAEALATCKENFELYWGQKLVNALRALHGAFYAPEKHGCDDENCECHHHNHDNE